MIINSSMILENSTDTNLNLADMCNNDFKSYIHGVLEFNDSMHKIYTESNKDYYRMLKEMQLSIDNKDKCLSLAEAGSSKVVDMVTKAIEAIISFIKKFIGFLTNKDTKIRHEYKVKAVKTRGFNIPDKINDSAVFTIYNYQSLADVDENKCRAALNNIISDIDRICDGNDMPMTDDSSMATAYKALARIVKNRRGRKQFDKPVNNAEIFKGFINNDVVYTDKEKMTYGAWRSSIVNTTPCDKTIIAKKLEGIRSDLEKCKSKIQKSNIVDADQKRNADMLLNQIKTIVTSYTWYINRLYDMETTQLKYILMTYNKVSANKINESNLMHGEPFNSDTLFDNDDMRDFNRTEWLDLELTTECYQLSWTMREVSSNVALKEAIILADDSPNKFNSLIVMREAEGTNLKERFNTIIERIKELINSFFDKLKSKFADNAKFIKDNMETINKPITIQSMKSAGDIISGMYRVQEKIELVPYNYDSMKDDLADKKVFFEKNIVSKLNKSSQFSKRSLTWSNDMNVTDYCKAYFGASMPEDKYPLCEYKGSEIEQNKNNIIKFLNDSNTFLSSIKSDLAKLESEAKKVANSAASNTQSSTSASDDKSKNESYFSELYNTWLTEVQIDAGDTEKADGDSGKSGKDESSAFRVYIDCYKDVLLSKLTASEFIVHELMQIMHKHVDMNK